MRILYARIAAAVLFASSFSGALADSHSHEMRAMHDMHSEHTRPVGVMGSHTHTTGQWMLSYRYMTMHMDGNRDGENDRSDVDVWSDGFGVAPTQMDMDMHMLGAMYGINDKWTFMAMLPYVRKTMDHAGCPSAVRMRTPEAPFSNCPAVKFTTRTSGMGDVKLSFLHPLLNSHDDDGHATWVLHTGLSVPTGGINEEDRTPMGRTRLPYPMQLGSGTYDPIFSTTWSQSDAAWLWGGQVSARWYTGTNSKGYRLGDRYAATAWLNHRVSPAWSFGARLNGETWRNIRGRDKGLNPALVPTARPDLRGGERVDLLAGFEWSGYGDALAGHTFGLEYGAPVYQDLNGPQLEVDYMFSLNWRYEN